MEKSHVTSRITIFTLDGVSTEESRGEFVLQLKKGKLMAAIIRESVEKLRTEEDEGRIGSVFINTLSIT